MPTHSKPFTSISDQIVILKGRGMSFSDEVKAQRCLARVGYYRLSAYWYPFREQVGGVRQDHCVAGTSFEETFDFYVFDKSLRLFVSDALERIEIALRAQIADLLGGRHKWAHRETSHLDGKFHRDRSLRRPALTKHQDWIRDQDQKFSRSKEDFADHFRQKYTGDPPIWVATEVWDWGMLSHFYAGMKQGDRDAISRFYHPNLDGRKMVSWVRALNDIRNICAHHSRLWNRGLVATLIVPPSGQVPELDHIVGNVTSLTRVYGALVVMALMMKSLHPDTKWHERLVALLATAPANPVIGTGSAGFPTGWDTEAIWTT